jgi:hypothetical protein
MKRTYDKCNSRQSMEKNSEKKAAEKPKKARITLECTHEIRKSIRIRAAQDDKSMNDYILSLVLKSIKK